MQHVATPAPTSADIARLGVLEAIARKVVMDATYNDQRLALAPHALFARRGELYASALNLTKIRRTDEEQRFGYFKVAGLRDVEVTEEPFNALPRAAATLVPHAGDELLLSLS